MTMQRAAASLIRPASCVFKPGVTALAGVTASLILLLASIAPAGAQGLMEFGNLDSNTHAAAGGLGAGLSASMGGGGALRRSYQSAADAQKAILEATKVIDQYYRSGVAYEAKKQWKYADMSFKYVLQIIALRDGPQSPTCVPVLEHLVATSKAEKKWDQAIGCQKTLVAYVKADKQASVQSLLHAQEALSDLFLAKQDYAGAEPVLKEAVSLAEKDSNLPPAKRASTYKNYALVLRKLKKNAEAEKIEHKMAPQAIPPANTPQAITESK